MGLMNIDRVPYFVSAFFIFVSLVLSGCATGNTHLLEINYIEAPAKTLVKEEKVIYIAPVILSKGINNKNYEIGNWLHVNNQRDIYVVGENITNLFHTGLSKALKEKGYTALEVEGWNLEPDQLPVFDKNIIALKVERFETTSSSSPMKVKSEFLLKVTGYLGIPLEYRVYSVTVNLQSTPTNLSISKEMVEKELSSLYSSGIRRAVTKLIAKIPKKPTNP